eukprot:CAMPEP_0206052434 /NCGR_PEP_ID=MMETSP1466-20131121/33760_1 /ASSEMBLY_ACC=CAM_ASM_001126 /TAXON_ID=44452 /ORGANISM="Pavlova gyrans, Strain CCMP608" /LENGTH=352 /DNA_ID=CAMNT_0053427589 /DNA_START=22 /DNA_END=1080 /DNA_ORIENTATION=+
MRAVLASAVVVALASQARAEEVDAAKDVGVANVEEVASWLDEAGFGDLKKAFAKNVIDGPALREITEEELKELGVKKVGARKLFGRLLCEALPDCERPDLAAPEGMINVTGFSVAEVGEWLTDEGFGYAVKNFASHTVDGPALLDLNEDELKLELGVSKLGPRRRFARRLCAVMPGCRNPKRDDEVAAWSASDVANWLEEKGMGKYKKAFANHEVDGLTLPDISEEDLKTDLAMGEIGLRKRYRTELCKLDKAFCQRDREGETAGDAGLGGVDLAQYLQRAQAFLSAKEKRADGAQAEAGAEEEKAQYISLDDLLKAAAQRRAEGSARGDGAAPAGEAEELQRMAADIGAEA